MSVTDVRRLGVLVLIAAAFGVGDSILKGNGDGIRAAAGNTATPWLLLPFAGGALVGRGRLLLGAAVGLILSLLALSSFYVANTYVLQLGPHPWIVDLRLTFNGGTKVFILALVSGPVFGGLGGWWAKTGSNLAPLVVAALFILEPIFGIVMRSNGSTIVWVVEILVGISAAFMIVRFAPENVST